MTLSGLRSRGGKSRDTDEDITFYDNKEQEEVIEGFRRQADSQKAFWATMFLRGANGGVLLTFVNCFPPLLFGTPWPYQIQLISTVGTIGTFGLHILAALGYYACGLYTSRETLLLPATGFCLLVSFGWGVTLWMVRGEKISSLLLAVPSSFIVLLGLSFYMHWNHRHIQQELRRLERSKYKHESL